MYDFYCLQSQILTITDALSFYRTEYFKMEDTFIISLLCLVILSKDTKFENLWDVNVFLYRTTSF